MAQDLDGYSTLIKERLNLNGGNFTDGEVDALRKLFEKIETELEELDSRVTTLEP